MTSSAPIYCLDANVLIQSWQKYYAPEICPDYWDILDTLGKQGRIFIPEEVRDEIVHNPTIDTEEDGLSKWLRLSSIPVYKTTESVIKSWKNILENNDQHKLLVDSARNRSLADPWVISHALNRNAIVVTKEIEIKSPNAKKPITIPNVCKNMKIHCINDHDFAKEIGLKFSCRL